jgi:photosystem II stability/assembly factor-like uncharacterized protein
MLSSTKSSKTGKTLIQTLFFFLLVTHLCFAQWYQQTSGTAKTLYSVYFISDVTGWACGDDEEIIKTTDGGNNWTQQNSNPTNYLSSIFFISESTGWAVGGNYSPFLGIVLKTTNGGNAWSIQTNSLPYQLNSVYFISPTTGWVAGDAHQILKTIDGGANWIPQTVEAAQYRGIFFMNENNGWAVGGEPNNTLSKILKTTDGGANWIAKTAATNNYLRALYFISETTGWVVGNEGVIFKTIDGGENWETQTSGTTNGLYSIAFVNSNTGWIAGGSGLILFTSDGGNNWTAQNSGTVQWLSSLCFSSESLGWAVGSNGTIIHTTNGGVTLIGNEDTGEIAAEFLLSQNYPNPFNPSTVISYQLPASLNPSKGGTFVTLRVYDILGSEIATLVNEEQSAGTYEVELNASQLSSGIYFYQLKVDEFILTKKMVLLR